LAAAGITILPCTISEEQALVYKGALNPNPGHEPQGSILAQTEDWPKGIDPTQGQRQDTRQSPTTRFRASKLKIDRRNLFQESPVLGII